MPMKIRMSLVVAKQRGYDYATSLKHNNRDASCKYQADLIYRSDKDRLHLNKHWANPTYADAKSSVDIRKLIRNDFDYAKANNLTSRSRFIAVTTNCKHTGQIETSITREIIFQLGEKADSFQVPIEIYMHFIEWLTSKYLGDIIRWDLHEDEGSRHLHVLVTSWSMEHHENYTKNSLVDSYKTFQLYAYRELKPICAQYNLDLLPTESKEKTKKEHIPIRMYERFILPVEEIVQKYESRVRVLKKFFKKLLHMTKNLKRDHAELNKQCELARNELKNLNQELDDKTNLVRKKNQELALKTQEYTSKTKKFEEYITQLEQKVKHQSQHSNELDNQIKYSKQMILTLSNEISVYVKQHTFLLDKITKIDQELEKREEKFMETLVERVSTKSIPFIEELLKKLQSSNKSAILKIVRDITEEPYDNNEPDQDELITHVWK